MTRDDIMRLAGRELDAAVAREVMHLSGLRQGITGEWLCHHPIERDAAGTLWAFPIPEYHSDYGAMGDVIAHFDTPGQFRLRHGASGEWWATFGQPGDCQGNTAPEAVARAALCQVMEV